MKKTPLIILSTYMIAAFAGVTFAWMSPPSSPRGTDAVLEYGDGTENTLSIQSKEISFKSYIYDEEAKGYVSTSEVSKSFVLIPNTHIKFRFDLTNSTNSIYKVKFQLANMTTNSAPYSEEKIPSLFSYLYFGINSAEGYRINYDYKDPVGTYTSLSAVEPLYGSYQITFIDDLNITPTDPEDEEHKVVSLYGYLLMSAKAGNEFINTTFSLGNFRVVL